MEVLLQIPWIKAFFGKSWVTTISGYITSLGLFTAAITLGWTELGELWDGNPETVFEWAKVTASFGLAIASLSNARGARATRDDNKSSEVTGAKEAEAQRLEKAKKALEIAQRNFKKAEEAIK